MPELSQLAGSEIEITLDGRKFKARSPSLRAYYGRIEAHIITQEIGNDIKAADAMGLQGTARSAFVANALESRPKGRVLQDLVWDFMGSPQGLSILFYEACREFDGELTEDECLRMVIADPDSADVYSALLLGLVEKKRVKQVRKKASRRTSTGSRKSA